jgi:hypothetical protein
MMFRRLDSRLVFIGTASESGSLKGTVYLDIS